MRRRGIDRIDSVGLVKLLGDQLAHSFELKLPGHGTQVGDDASGLGLGGFNLGQLVENTTVKAQVDHIAQRGQRGPIGPHPAHWHLDGHGVGGR